MEQKKSIMAISASLWVLELSQNTPSPNTPKRSILRRQRSKRPNVGVVVVVKKPHLCL